jgi:glycosyltransferase involved in cell wall biosynthesis
MKILMSAFSCGPGRGSEPGVGWNVALETARLGHDVVVLTQSMYRENIEREIAAGRLPPNLRFDIFMPGWLEKFRDAGLRLGFSSLIWQSVNVLWQFCALRHARRHYRQAGFDLVHHVTFAGIRHPTLLTRLGLPTVIGPLGGGDRAPMVLRKTFPWYDWCTELLRDAYNLALRVDPITRLAFRDAALIVLRTDASLIAVPPRYRNKVYIKAGLGIAEKVEATPVVRTPREAFRLIYAGELFYLKGVHLGLRALAAVRAQGLDATLTIVGDGRARRDLEKLALELGVSAHVTWHGWVLRQELLGMYGGHHAFLFPSLRDASPTVIVEAWAHGLPVICLDLGGPGKMVNETCGRVVPVAGRGESECVAGLAAEIMALSGNEALRLALSHGAIARYREFSWSRVVASLYDVIEDRLQRSPAIRVGLKRGRPVTAMPRTAVDADVG